MAKDSKQGLASRLGRATLRRIGLHHDHPSFGFRTTRIFSRGLWSTLDIRQRPSIRESFGQVDGDGGRALFAEHCSKETVKVFRTTC
ncbi:MAG: hypothetical protein OXH65_03185 [Paracoccaceae bacterium]|nr:hypothetical protein [Paracoccaceae bacterium]